MSDHYYSESPNSESQPRQFQTKLKGETFVFNGDRGVFSKTEVDFGSRLLIESLELPDVKGPVLDVGCGYGAIGITIARLWQNRQVTLIDINERAVDLARMNCRINHVNAEVLQSNLYEKVEEGRYALIVTNPPIRAGKQVVFDIFEGAKARLLRDGELWVVIQKKQGAPSTLEKLKTLFGEVEVVVKKKGYFIIKAKNIDASI
ncbi:methyltransferase [Pullulanibacillus camelliae]|uniref:Methyltransferase n=1 Tax=Pullulanibacillus camelliae TaxID=1707096 RepID=A0A8J2YMT8_9BACL|nr:class I SAM-dependent methyltransferase [Pullulanibacillus camelliae]GGE54303.1 methyltransferase [Pullulanibacillus camelliae]